MRHALAAGSAVAFIAAAGWAFLGKGLLVALMVLVGWALAMLALRRDLPGGD